ncbi:MAG: hypothetical protein HYU03_06915 [Thaumarchaeota archaeon]|nr:hypothetical protein [Nitrososphaerota archaeon]
MGEYTESFTVDASMNDVRELSIKYLTGFKYKLTNDQNRWLTFEKGSKRQNFYPFSFDRAYKHVVIALVGNEDVPVTTLSVSFTLPFLHLSKDETEAIKTVIRSLRKFIVITVGYRRS